MGVLVYGGGETLSSVWEPVLQYYNITEQLIIMQYITVQYSALHYITVHYSTV